MGFLLCMFWGWLLNVKINRNSLHTLEDFECEGPGKDSVKGSCFRIMGRTLQVSDGADV